MLFFTEFKDLIINFWSVWSSFTIIAINAIKFCGRRSHHIPPANVNLLQPIKARENSGTGNSPDNVDASASEESFASFGSYDFLEAGPGTWILDCLAGRHHHPPFNGVQWVGGYAGHDGDQPTEEKCFQPAGRFSENWKMKNLFIESIHTKLNLYQWLNFLCLLRLILLLWNISQK